jgi:hypothetical protein
MPSGPIENRWNYGTRSKDSKDATKLGRDRMSDVGTTHEDLERFLGEHYLVGAGLKRDKRATAR